MKRAKSFLVGAVLGSVAAGLTALLLTPKKGKDMRKLMKKKYDCYSDKAEDLLDDMSEQALELVERAQDLASDAKEAASSFLKEIKKK